MQCVFDLIPALDTSNGQHSNRTVTDADEEIFLLYTLSAPEPDRFGLGQVDNKSDLLQVTLDLHDATSFIEVCSIEADDVDQKSKAKTNQTFKATRHKEKRDTLGSIQVFIRQDSTSLRSTSGDTGSVIWRSSLYLAEKILRDFNQCMKNGKSLLFSQEQPNLLISPFQLAQCNVLELGSGTGILPLLLLSHSYLAHSSCTLVWLATDQASMLSLLKKNVASYPQICVEEVDWVQASKVYQSPSDSIRQSYLRDILASFNKDNKQSDFQFANFILATDCIFNPFLFQPFIDTLNIFSFPQKTIVMVVCELRESEAMTEFLETWLKKGKKGEQWSIHTLEGQEVVGSRLLSGSVVWVAWRLCRN